MNTANNTDLKSAALAYALALVEYNETVACTDDQQRLNAARDALYMAHETLNDVAKAQAL